MRNLTSSPSTVSVNVFHVKGDETFGGKYQHDLGENVVYFTLNPVTETVDGDEVRLLITGQPNVVDVTQK